MENVIRKSFGAETHTIDGVAYEFYQLKASEQLRTLTLLAKQFGFGLTDFLASILKQVNEKKELRSADNLLREISIDESQLTRILREIITNLDDDLIYKIIDTLMKGVRHKGQQESIKWEFEFQGRLTAMFKVLYLSFMRNYKDFLFKGSDAPV